MKVGLPALRAADPGGAVLRPGFHRPAALLLARPLRLLHLGVGLSRGSEKLPHRLERLHGGIRLSMFTPPPLGAVRCACRAGGNGGRLRAEGACAVTLGASRQRVDAHAVMVCELPRIIEADSPSVLPRA